MKIAYQKYGKGAWQWGHT